MCLLLPVEISFVSDDGTFDEVEQTQIATECGFSWGVGLRQPLATWQGGIGKASEGWSTDAYAEVDAGFEGDRVTFDAYLLPDGRSEGGRWLLRAVLPASAELTEAQDLSLSRAQVGSSDDVVIRTEGCGGGFSGA